MKYLYLFFFTLIFSNAFPQSDISIKKPEYKRVAQTFGYLMGQEYTLEAIKEKFPELEFTVKKAAQEFNSNFGIAKENIINQLKKIYGTKYKAFEDTLRIKLEKVLSAQEIDKTNSANYLLEVESRTNGKIPSPVLETLLSFQFKDNPEREFLTGSTYTFKTKGHPKAKNTNWQINIPKSWYQKEGDRPNIIQGFTSEYGDGQEMILLMVKDFKLPKGYKPSQKELSDLFSEKGMKDMIPEGAKFISSKKMTLDNYIGGVLEIEQKVERLDVTAKIRMLQFMFVKQNKMYVLQCGIMGLEDEDLNIRTKKFMPLYKLVANSIVENDQYK